MTARHARVALGLATLTAFGLSAAQSAHAQGFSGAYDPSKFTTTATQGTATITPGSGPATTVDFISNWSDPSDGGVPGETYTYTVPAAGSGTVTFSYNFTGNDAYFEATTFLTLVDVTAGTSVALVPTGTITFGNFDYAGTGTLAVSANDVFGFEDGGSNGDSTSIIQGDLTITNFVAPAAAPEPSQYAGLGLGVLGISGLAFKARRQTRTA